MKFSENLRTFVAGRGGYRQALQGGRMVIYSGAAPTLPSDTATGSALCEVVASNGGAHVAETRATVLVEVTVTGTCTGITLEGIPICGAVTIPGTTLAADAAAIVEAINKFQGGIPCEAIITTGAAFNIFAPAGSGTAFNTTGSDKTIAISGTITTTINGGSADEMGVGTGGSTAGVANSYGVQFDEASAGTLSIDGTWSGTVDITGTAGYFRIYGNKDTSGNYYTAQGTCGTSGADYNMGSTSLVAGIVHPVASGVLTFPVGA